MAKVGFHFTQAFLSGPPAAATAGPSRKAELEAAHQRLYRALRRIERAADPRWLTLSHLDAAAHVRAGYPPAEFGAFLSALDAGKDLVRFRDIVGLKDADEEGYLTRYAGAGDLHCAALFTCAPSARMVFFAVDGKTAISTLIGQMKSAAEARKLIAGARRL
ncbi:hypothetical protein ATO6_08885 [Oceanicola sp. 22II-s10i]|uniref:hypothetical protein n=1 Tax=Oceanicola sp. 22II-s10i TaxID=1317116 RepID=UPI000B5265C3|nr:hypothetical protein [Oceanicola sp. 22II-s10i]OWU85146.1 hypothetical protein ATO6_08885 [Oceanicola sp. 22II-s10i]